MTIQNWEKMDISPKISFIKGKAPKTLINNPEPGYLLYLTPELLRGNSPSIEYCSEKESISVSNNEVIILWDGSNAGEIFKAKTGALASTMARINIQSLAIDSSYLFYFLKNYEYRIKNQVRGSGIPHVDRKVFSELPDDFPVNLSEQRKIAEILTTVDDAIEQTEALIQKYQRIKQGLMQDLLTRGVDENGSLRPPPELAPHLYIETPQGWLPKGWEISSIKDVCKLITSGSRGWARYYSEDGALFLRIGNLSRENINLRLDSIQRVNAPKNSEGKRTSVAEGDILISITADLGVIGVIPPDIEEAYCNQHIALVRVDSSRTNPRWLGHYLASMNGQKQFILLNDSGAKAGLNLPTVSSIKFTNPPKEERDTIVRILDHQDKMIEVEINHRNKFEQLKEGLMQDLLTGKVRVH